MKRTVLRVFDGKDKYSLTGECYFLVMPEGFEFSRDYEDVVVPNLARVTSMSWQNYDGFLVGETELEEDELFWSEITGYELHECKIDIDRVEVSGKYKLPQMFTHHYYS